jgi:hypothetical protein
MIDSGRGAAWLARLLGVQEVPSSNLGGPTKFLKDLPIEDLPEVAFWSPFGVQKGRQPKGLVAPGAHDFARCFYDADFSRPLRGSSKELLRRLRPC